MLKPMLVQISLQNRGEVITERRARFDNDEAHRVYNALEALLLTESEAQDWPTKLWPTINRRRGELICKNVVGSMTAEERAELATLQEYADAYVARFDVPKLEALQALEAKLQGRKTGLPESQ